MRTMTARYAGKCEHCWEAFPAGTTIGYNGRPWHPACLEALAAADREESAWYAKSAAAFKAGEMIRSIPGEKEIRVEGAPTYEMARAEAFAVVASIRAAGGWATLLKHVKNGKKYLGRELVHYGEGSNLGHREGWAFSWKVATP